MQITQDEITPMLTALERALKDPSPLIDELGWMGHKHVNSRIQNKGYSREYAGRGGQKRFEKVHDVTKRIREMRGHPKNNPPWNETGDALSGIVTLKHTKREVEIGWPFGKYKNDYPYRVAGGVPRTSGMIPGKTIEPREVLYVTKGFIKLAVKAAWRWWLGSAGIKVE